MVICNKKINVSPYIVVFVVMVCSTCSQSSSLSNTNKVKIITEKILSVEDSLINDASIIERISKYVKSFEWAHSIHTSIYDDEIFLSESIDEIYIYKLELRKTVFNQAKRVEGYEHLIYFFDEYIRDNSNNVIAQTSVVACENKIDVCSKIHEEMIEKGITSIFKNFGDNWTIVGYHGVW
jgi:hypothetical protein